MQETEATWRDLIGQEIDPAARWFFIVIGCCEVLCGVAGNTLLVSVLFGRSLRTHSFHNLFVANLAVADLVIQGYWLLFFLLDLILGYHPVASTLHCRVNGFIICIVSVVDSLSLLSISMNRYLHVCHSRLYHRLFSLPTTLLWCLVLWVLGVVIALPPLIGVGSYRYSPSSRFCSFYRDDPNKYAKVMVVLFCVVPMIIVGYFNFAIFRYWRRFRFKSSSSRKGSSQNPERETVSGRTYQVRFEAEEGNENDVDDKDKESDDETESDQVQREDQQNVKETGMRPTTACVMSQDGVPLTTDDTINHGCCSEDTKMAHPGTPRKLNETQRNTTRGLTAPAADLAQSGSSSGQGRAGQGQQKPASPKSPARGQGTNPRSLTRQQTDKRRRKEEAFVRSLFVVFLLMVISFLPFGVSIVIGSYVVLPPEVSIASNLVLFFNSAVNWIVYGVMNPSFKRMYINSVRRLCVPCCRRSEEGEDSRLALSSSSQLAKRKYSAADSLESSGM